MTKRITNLLSVDGISPPLSPAEAQTLKEKNLDKFVDGPIHPRSITATDGRLFFLAGNAAAKKLIGLSFSADRLNGFDGHTRHIEIENRDVTLLTAPMTSQNAARLSAMLPFLTPTPFGLAPSVGCGDRLGLATPGHIRAVAKTTLAPILAQQSVRENERTGRTPRVVLEDAMWSVFQEGWRNGFGADADHLKTREDVEAFAAAGYTFFTIDPGDHVDNSAQSASKMVLERKIKELPWPDLESTCEDLIHTLARNPIRIEDFTITLSEEEVLRAAAKYGRVVAHSVTLYRHLLCLKQSAPFDLEISVDETDTVTSLAEHIYLAAELKRLGVDWVSLAPRYVGDFEKGVDYIGELARFATDFDRHAAVARTYGSYKLSLHSGSDKFRIYPIVARRAKNQVHLKTAGTSYLEALRAVSQIDAALFRRIFAFAEECYPQDRISYHVSAETARLPRIETVPDEFLPHLLDFFHAREILHVTYGSVINHPHLRTGLFAALQGDIDHYYHLIEIHFDRHFKPFA